MFCWYVCRCVSVCSRPNQDYLLAQLLHCTGEIWKDSSMKFDLIYKHKVQIQIKFKNVHTCMIRGVNTDFLHVISKNIFTIDIQNLGNFCLLTLLQLDWKCTLALNTKCHFLSYFVASHLFSKICYRNVKQQTAIPKYDHVQARSSQFTILQVETP